MLVGHGEGCLRQLRVAETDVVRDGDDPFAVRVDQRAEQCPALVPVGLDERLHEPRAERREAVEAQVGASLRQPAEERQQPLGVVAGGRSQAERPAVAEDDVGEASSRHRVSLRACERRETRARVER